jgi:hypothetical protein
MLYSTPELVGLGPAAVVVLGGDIGRLDNGDTPFTKPLVGMALGLDD